MKLTKCEKIDNHFYDGDKYKCCPYCNDEKVALKETIVSNTSLFQNEQTSVVMLPDSDVTVMDTDDEMTVLIDDEHTVIADDDQITVKVYDEQEAMSDAELEAVRQQPRPALTPIERVPAIIVGNGTIRCINCFEEYQAGMQVCPTCGYKDGDTPKELYHIFPGLVLNDRYIIGEVLGFGGFGITYKAWDRKLDTVVAVKEYYPSGIVNRVPGTKEVVIYAQKRTREFELGKDRFLNEARNMAKFNSEKNIVNVFEFFEENNTAYIVMEYLRGITLSQHLHEHGAVNIDYGIEVTNAVCNALSKLHAEGIIHRDISPDNIFLCNDGAIKLIDFGAARFANDENKKMTIILKPGFAPPEQYEKINKQGPWTDIYALGATLYYIITGVKPEESTNRKINDKLVYPHEVNSKIPKNLSNTIMKAMAIDVPLRFKNVKEFHDALNKNKKILPVAIERRRRKQRRFAGITAAVLILGAGLGYSYKQWNDEKEAEWLPDSSITIWYCKSGDKTLDEAEEAAYKAIAEDFKSSFSDSKISITILGFDKNEYEEKLKSGDERPNIFEYTGADAEGKRLSLKLVYESDFGKSCSQLEKAETCYGSYDYLPLGYNVPVFFRKTSFEGDAPERIKTAADLEKIPVSSAFKYVVDNEQFLKMYDLEKSRVEENAYQTFQNDAAVFYGTYTHNYFTVMDELAARYELYSCDVDKIICKYDNVFCANDIGKDENIVSLRLLEFMLSSNAQDEIHIQNNLHSLPINDDVVKDYTNVYREMEIVFDNSDRFVFEK